MERSFKEIQAELDQVIIKRDFETASQILVGLEAPEHLKLVLIEGALRMAHEVGNKGTIWPGL